MRITTLITLLCTLAIVAPASARMYEWVNPATGRVQLSGSPPTWYRGSIAGPRVRVFENGSLVDDTAIQLGASDNAALRELALAKADQHRQNEALRQLEIATQREAAMRNALGQERERLAAAEEKRRQSVDEAKPADAAAAVDTVASAKPPDIPEVLDAKTIERLKALISEFDRAQ